MVENRKEPNFRGSKKKGHVRKSNLINFIGLIILAVSLITAAIIIVFYFSVEVKVENSGNNTETSATTITETQTNNNSDTPGAVAPSEEIVPEPVPSEEPAENMPSEEDKEANNPSEEGETEMSVLRVKVQIDHIGKVWTRWINISQAEGSVIGHDEIVQIVLTDMSKEFGNTSYVKSVGNKADHTFGETDAIYNTIIWIIG